jgi:hypothetical protein
MRSKKKENRDAGQNASQQAVDKAPGEERGKTEQVSTADLKGKKVDADPADEQEKKSGTGKVTVTVMECEMLRQRQYSWIRE